MKNLKIIAHVAMISITVICACNEVPRRNSEKTLDGVNMDKISPEKTSQNSSPLICDLRDKFDEKTIIFIQKNSRKIISSIENNSQNEGCIFGLIDSISLAAQNDKSISYFIALDSLAQKSDGFLGEYLDEICRDLFYKDFSDLSDYLSRYPNSSLLDFTQSGLSTAFSVIELEKRDSALENMKNIFEKRIAEESLSLEAAETVRKILSNVNPSLFD